MRWRAADYAFDVRRGPCGVARAQERRGWPRPCMLSSATTARRCMRSVFRRWIAAHAPSGWRSACRLFRKPMNCARDVQSPKCCCDARAWMYTPPCRRQRTHCARRSRHSKRARRSRPRPKLTSTRMVANRHETDAAHCSGWARCRTRWRTDRPLKFTNEQKSRFLVGQCSGRRAGRGQEGGRKVKSPTCNLGLSPCERCYPNYNPDTKPGNAARQRPVPGKRGLT